MSTPKSKTPAEWLEIERGLIAKLADLRADLAAQRSAAAETALECAEQPLIELQEIQLAIGVTDEAIDRARGKRCEAILAHWRDEAALKRKQAATRRREADKHSERTNELLAALKAHEGVDYVPTEPPRSTPGTSASMFIRVPIPRSQALRNEADSLECQASMIESRKVPDAGQATGVTDDELVNTACADPMRIAPRADAIRAWAAEAVEQFEQWRSRHQLFQPEHAATPRFTLTWKAGAIDERASKGEPVLPKPERAKVA